MQITFISLWQVFVTAAALGLALLFYFKLVRPKIEGTWAFVGFHGKVVPWLKARWDMTAAFAIAMAPIVWNGALDLIIAISLLLADVLPAIAGLDLSELVLPPWAKTLIQVSAAVLPAIRASMLAKKES